MFRLLTAYRLLPTAYPLAVTIDRVLDLMTRGGVGYAVLFGMLFLCGLGLPVPEDIPLIVSGILIGSHKMHLAIAAPLAWAGIIGGDCVLYFLGRRYGLNITRVPFVGKHVTEARIEKAEKLFQRWGIWVVAVGRLFAGIRGAMVVAAGTIRFSFLKFIIADGLAALVSGGLFIWLGMKFGQNLHYIEIKIHKYGEWVFWGVVLIALGFAFYYWWKRRGHRGPSEIAVDTIEKVAEHGIHLPPLHRPKDQPAAPKDAPAR